MKKKVINISGVSDAYSKNIHEVSSKLFKSGFLTDKKIAISISESEDMEELGFHEFHLKDATIEITRYLLVNGAKLLYGGDLRKGGFTKLFSELSFQYRDKGNMDEMVFTNYFSWPIHTLLQPTDKAEFKKNRVIPILVKPYENIPEELKTKFVSFDTNENRFYWAKSLTKMRKEMVNATEARIFIGGRTSGYKGSYSGVLEEFLLSIKNDNPLYLIGAFGGVSKAIINILSNKKDDRLTADIQLSNNEYKEFVAYFNSNEKQGQIDYNKVQEEISQYGLSKLSKNNGLSKDENKRLFETPHIPEMIFLILKGLSKKYRK